MILFFSAVGLDFLFTPQQKVFANCYDQSSILEYNKNLNIIIVTIRPINSACESLSKNLHAALIMRGNDIPLQRSQVLGFNYSSITSIKFIDVPVITSLDFAIMYLYSYSDIAQVNIFEFQEQKSDLSECYQTNSVLQIHQEEIVLNITSTLSCTQQITTIEDSGITINKLVQVFLLIQGERIQLEAQQFSDNYIIDNKPINYIYKQPIKLLHIQQVAFVSAKVQFISQQQDVQVSFIHQIGYVKNMGKDFGFGVNFYYLSASYVGLWDDTFLVQVNNRLIFQPIENILNDINFTHYTHRLSVKLGSEVWSKQLNFYSTKYNNLQRIYRFECSNGSPTEQESCKQFYYKIKTSDQKPRFMFDTMFYTGEQFLFNQQLELQMHLTCWRSGVIDIRRDSLCLQLTIQQNTTACDIYLPQGEIYDAQGIISLIFPNTSIPDLKVPLYKQISAETLEYCLSCDELVLIQDCKAFINDIAQNDQNYLGITMKYTSETLGALELSVITNRIAFSDYSIVNIIAYISGLSFVLVSTAISLMGIILVIQTIKKNKKRRKNH
ncbi:hypothetical protein SS50377_21111 [Spironucleus salmonicida]|uniref:Transmembrane protein n=1 Tax=Spironucleus salmonicida TaxID=348837 RepID=V6LH76_9EUKA|nr:hypothetical protein SS50377_21111 [Spironucleus salmonicida]|eukprot:EST43892.1 Hypothetical protein SS50377_16192 [Spironucleus salmonicida]